MLNKIKWKLKPIAYHYHVFSARVGLWFAERVRNEKISRRLYAYHGTQNMNANRIVFKAMSELAEKASSTKEDEPT